jgi:multidrug efflux pump subunit AcrB
MMVSIVAIFILSIGMISCGTGHQGFPQADPNFIFVFTSLPIGTDQSYTDSVTKIIEGKVYKAIGWPNNLVKVSYYECDGGCDGPSGRRPEFYPNKSKVQVAFIEYGKRNGQSTAPYIKKIRDAVRGAVPGLKLQSPRNRVVRRN